MGMSLSSVNKKENCSSIPLEESIKMNEANVKQNSDPKNIEPIGKGNTVEKYCTENSRKTFRDMLKKCKLNLETEECNGNSNIKDKVYIPIHFSTQYDSPSENDHKYGVPDILDQKAVLSDFPDTVNFTNFNTHSSGIGSVKIIREEVEKNIKAAKSVEEIEQLTLIKKIIDLTQKFTKGRDESEAELTPEQQEMKSLNLNENLKEQSNDTLKHTMEEVTASWQFRTVSTSNDTVGIASLNNDEDYSKIFQSQHILSNSKEAKLSPDLPIMEDYIFNVCEEDDGDDFSSIQDVSDLDIDVKKEEFLHIGNVDTICDTLVIVAAIDDTPVYDVDTVIFVEDDEIKRPLGAISEVVGPIAPLYLIRLQKASQVTDLNVQTGMKVFCAPNSKYTKYAENISKHTDTDTLWEDNFELPPEIVAQFSNELQAELQNCEHGSQKCHCQFEDNMNLCNILRRL